MVKGIGIPYPDGKSVRVIMIPETGSGTALTVDEQIMLALNAEVDRLTAALAEREREVVALKTPDREIAGGYDLTKTPALMAWWGAYKNGVTDLEWGDLLIAAWNAGHASHNAEFGFKAALEEFTGEKAKRLKQVDALRAEVERLKGELSRVESVAADCSLVAENDLMKRDVDRLNGENERLVEQSMTRWPKDTLEAAVKAAYRKGAEDMRESAFTAGSVFGWDAYEANLQEDDYFSAKSKAIAALPLEQGKEEGSDETNINVYQRTISNAESIQRNTDASIQLRCPVRTEHQQRQLHQERRQDRHRPEGL